MFELYWVSQKELFTYIQPWSRSASRRTWPITTMYYKLAKKLRFLECYHGTYLKWYLRTRRANVKESMTFWNKIRFVTALDLNKCLKQIRYPTSLYPCAPFLNYHRYKYYDCHFIHILTLFQFQKKKILHNDLMMKTIINSHNLK